MMRNIYELKIEGKDVRRFINQLYSSGISFEYVNICSKTAIVKVSSENYERIKNIKTIYSIELLHIYGPNKVKTLIKKYNVFLISLLLGFILLNFLGNIVFDIEIDCDDADIKTLLVKELASHGIKKYSPIKDYSERKKIIDDIVKNNPNSLEWMEIERYGVKYVVRTEKRIIKNKKDDCQLRHIVAAKEGLITNIYSSSGEIKKEINDYVKKGDIIISGFITKDETQKNSVCADGKVIAETWYRVTVEVPYHYQEVIYTKERKRNISVTIFNKRYSLFKDFDHFITKETALESDIIPFKISLEDNQKIIKIDQIYTSDEADLKALELARIKLKNILGENDKILQEKKLKTIAKDSTMEVVIFFKVREDITSYQNIE